ncbi:MAG: O-sialoglycoprotein endopeptidase-like protein [Gammaproteobacteria bacterium]|nr:O-sialoglycoprotein endopeptidase-like protein [Gammaproteobacteria bacterium]
MRVLALDTATENCTAAVLIDGRVLAREIEIERGHAERILPMIDELLVEAGTTLGSLDGIAFGRGPGSFTGVRLAVTVTQGLAFGAGVGVVPISDLRAVAQRALNHDPTINRVLVCNDARMSEVYWACYERGVDGLATLEGDEHVGKPLTVALPEGWTDAVGVGRGFTAYADDLRTAVPGAFTYEARTGDPSVAAQAYERFLPRAVEIISLAAPEVAGGRLVSAEGAIPIYLRDNVAHVAKPKT